MVILIYLFIGNLGKYGVEGLIKKIKNLTNVKILLEDENRWQIVSEAKEYIKNNYLLDDEKVESFSIYYK